MDNKFKFNCDNCNANVTCFCIPGCSHELCPICELIETLEPVISDPSWRGKSAEEVCRLQEAVRLEQVTV